MQSWRIFDTGKASAEKNMVIDAELLDKLAEDQNRPILHLYDWEAPWPPMDILPILFVFLNQAAISKGELHIGRRPTGGGIIFHLTDLAFSIVVPASYPAYSLNVLNNYAFVNNIIIKAIKKFTGQQSSPGLLPDEPQGFNPLCKHFCMAKPTKYDVMLEGRKVGGGAQRRTKYGFLHQGSISLALPPTDFLNKVLLPHEYNLLDAMQATTYALIPGQPTLNQLDEARHHMCWLLIDAVMEGCFLA